MSDLTLNILAPTVVAAVVSAAALLARELLVSRARKRDYASHTTAQGERSRQDRKVKQHAVLLQQIQLLWAENTQLRQREADCEQRYRDLERRCADLERCCGDLRRRLDRLGRVVGSERSGSRPRD